MKKITMLAFLSFCAIGFGQNKSQDIKKETKSTTGIEKQTVTLPAAYFRNSTSIVAENTTEVSPGPRNNNLVIPLTGTYYGNSPNAILYDNGPYFNTPGSPNVSLLQGSLGNTTLGAGAQFAAGNRMADDVTLPESVNITNIDMFAYQTGSEPPTINAVYVQVWDGDPSTGTANVLWGDLVTDIIEETTYAEANRASEANPTNADRKIQRVNALTNGLSLAAGTYWIEYTFDGSGASGPWAPPISILGEAATGNAIQYTDAAGAYAPFLDGGASAAPQGLPFVLYGEVVLGVADNGLTGFSYYPNPASNSITLSSVNKIDSASIYNLLGQKVLDVTVNAASTTLNISGLTTGAYLLKVSVDGQIGTYKIIKE